MSEYLESGWPWVHAQMTSRSELFRSVTSQPIETVRKVRKISVSVQRHNQSSGPIPGKTKLSRRRWRSWNSWTTFTRCHCLLYFSRVWNFLHLHFTKDSSFFPDTFAQLIIEYVLMSTLNKPKWRTVSFGHFGFSLFITGELCFYWLICF